MPSLRLQTLASFIEINDKVADIGCDHAYLAIYLAKNNICAKVIAADINSHALDNAKNNIKKNNLEDKIPTCLSDGLENIDDSSLDTLIISGMGTSTILHIVDTSSNLNIKKLVLQSNNNLYELRTILRKKGFYLQKEKVIFEGKHYYVIGVYTKTYQKLNVRERLFGKYDSLYIDYYTSLYNELLLINKSITYKNIIKKIKIYLKLILLKKYL
jgi:tRNA (adenine22-N1)-methyltransferase